MAYVKIVSLTKEGAALKAGAGMYVNFSEWLMFKKRSDKTELMDDLSLTGEALHRNLDELEVINRWLGGFHVVTAALDELIQSTDFKAFSGKTLKIADLGCGGGDTLRHVARWARKRKIKVELTGIDANAFMISYASPRCHLYPEIRLHRQNIFSEKFKQQNFDIIISSLFCHHFPDDKLAQMLRQWHQQANLGVIINDLHRHPLAYYSIRFLTAAFSNSYLVKHDAPLSVLRAFRKEELKALLQQAGIEDYQLRWMWAFRWQLLLQKPQPKPAPVAKASKRAEVVKQFQENV